MRPPFKQRHPLFRPLAVMTISILGLFSLSYFLIINSSNKLNLNAAVLKIASTQRSLSQQITNFIAADNLEGQLLNLPMDSFLAEFGKLQDILLNGNNDLNVAPLKKDMMKEYQKLNVAYTSFFKQLDRNISDDNNRNFVSLLTAENTYLQQLDIFTNNLAGYSNTEVKNFKIKEMCILFTSIIFIFLEIRLIFLPAIKKIELQNAALREISFTQAHIIRRPLTNIQSILSLTLDTKKHDPYSLELLKLAKKEADELDAAIKSNIYKSDKNYKSS